MSSVSWICGPRTAVDFDRGPWRLDSNLDERKPCASSTVRVSSRQTLGQVRDRGNRYRRYVQDRLRASQRNE